MKIFLIKSRNEKYGYLFIDDNYENAYIELIYGLSKYPIFFKQYINRNILMINNDMTQRWIDERVIPYYRQNINNIIKDNGLKTYNPILLFLKVSGRSSMDDNYLVEIKKEDIDLATLERLNKHIKDYILTDEGLIIFFNDGNTKYYERKKNMSDPFLSPFGNEIIFTSKERYTYLELYDKGVQFPMLYNDLINYLNENIISSKQITENYGISRQYLNILSKNKKIKKLNNNLYIKNEFETYKNSI